MKVLHINSNYLHSPLYSEMISKMEQINIDSDVLMPRKVEDESNVKCNLVENNAQIYHKQFLKPIDRFLYFKKQNKITKWINSLEINVCEYDIIHAHTLFSDAYQAYKLDKPYVVTVRNTDINFYMKYYKHLLPIGKKILRKASKIIFLSKSYEKITVDKLFKDKREKADILQKSYVIPNGINDFWIEHANNDIKEIGDKVNIVCVCRIMKNKNLSFLAENLKSENLGMSTNIYVIGDVIEQEYYDKLKEFENIVFLGKKDKEEIIEVMKDMDIFSMVSFNETFGLVYLEALTQNLPVIYTKNEGFDKYFKDGLVGYPVSPTNNDELITNTKKIIDNYGSIQKNISQLNKEDFSWTSNALQHKKLYESIKASVLK
ncbi:glycosyltransferase family 4 protein [Staphylococcus simulans]|uniref:glycosyltransferase family 4 protein n=1 Tax=Staphylococcus simulans TaxID=1286 RepID=UPI000D0344CB|nr:glycosyltransferase family 4 protein [Staphylococcus simulans]